MSAVQPPSYPAREWIRVLAITGLGSGFLRPAPGTWGSLTGCILFALLTALLGLISAPHAARDVSLIVGIALASFFSVAWGDWAMLRFNSKDPKHFVLDEVAGQWVALLVLPALAFGSLWAFACVLAVQFLLFRVFDIIKPFPARQLERLPAGWGILTDDLFAGLYANLVGQAIWHWTLVPRWLGIA